MFAFFAGLPFGWAFFLAFCAVVAFGLFCAGVMIQGFLEPLYGRINKRDVAPKQFKPDYKLCCPPGLGCNDPQHAPCRRQLAYKLADAHETAELDELWSNLNRHTTPSNLAGWEAARDQLINEKLKGGDNTQVKALLGRNETLELVRGEVTD